MKPPTNISVEYGAHHVTLTPVPVRRWVDPGPWELMLRLWGLTVLGGVCVVGLMILGYPAAPWLFALCAPVPIAAALTSRHETHPQTLQITAANIEFGRDRWPLDRIEDFEGTSRGLWVWVRLADGLLRRYEIGPHWTASEQNWLADVLRQAVDAYHDDDAPEAPEALRQMLSRGQDEG